MPRPARLILLAVGALVSSRVLAAEGPCRVLALPGAAWCVTNGVVGRVVSLSSTGPRTVSFGPAAGAQFALEPEGSEEFVLRLDGGQELRPRDFTWQPQEPLPVDKGVALVFEGLGRTVPLRVRLLYTVLPGRTYMWKQVSLQASQATPVLVRDVQVEHAKLMGATTDLGGLGQPVFVTGKAHGAKQGEAAPRPLEAFWGLEYPAAENAQKEGLVTLEHHPGALVEAGRWWHSKPAVLGVTATTDAATAFRQYLAEVRRAPRSYVVYNSWYDVQRGEMNVPVLIDRAKQFHEELTVKRAAPFDAAALDDGWQDPQSIWEIDQAGFPNGFRELHEGLKPMNVAIGLWHPLTAMRYNLDTDWGLKNGYEVSPDKSFFCLSGPKYNQALRDELRRHTTEYEIDYFKHDFNAFDCPGQGHGHLPEAIYGREANVDAEIEMFRFLSQTRPGVYLNPSGGMWLSPWWLKYVDTVWMQHCDDFGYDRRVVAYEPRDWEMTYRDHALFQNLHGDRAQFPVSGIMTIGIIDGKLNRLGGEHEPLDRWANNVMVNVGRGSMLKELYLTPGLLSAPQWDVLAAALKWQRQFVKQMASGRMLPVDPETEGVYGYAHLDGDGGFICLRNAGIVAREATVPLPELDPRAAYSALRVYPWHEALAWPRGEGAPLLRTAVEPFGTTIVEVHRGSLWPTIQGVRASVVSRKPGEVTYDLWGHPGTDATAEISAPTRIAALSLGDQPMRPRGARHSQRVRFPGQPLPASDVRAVESEAKPGGTFELTVAPGEACRFVVVARGITKTTALQLAVDGKPTEAERLAGQGWEAFICSVPEGQRRVGWNAAPEKQTPGPFASQAYTVQPFLVREAKLASVRLTVSYAPGKGALPELPATPCAGVERTSWSGPEVTVAPEAGPQATSVTEADLANAKAAKLHIMVFGSQGGDDYGRKWLVLNGQRIGAVPANQNAGQPDAWEEFVIDLTAEQVKGLKLQNELVIERQTADCFKLGDLALAVQRPDGRWAETNHDARVWCSVPGWVYDEGEHFGDRTPGIRLEFRRG